MIKYVLFYWGFIYGVDVELKDGRIFILKLTNGEHKSRSNDVNVTTPQIIVFRCV